MNDPSARQSSQNVACGADIERLLSELDSAISQQISLVQNDDLETVEALAGRVDEVLQRVGTICTELSPTCAERLKRIYDLYRKLCLILAQRRDELAHELARLSRGSRGLRAYRDASRRSSR